MNLALYLALLLLSAVAKKTLVGVYSSIDSETCPELQSEKDFFKFLLDCGTYKSDTIANVCMQSTDILSAMKAIPEWVYTEDQVRGDSIFRSFDFNDFKAAFTWMTQVAQIAEKNGKIIRPLKIYSPFAMSP